MLNKKILFILVSLIAAIGGTWIHQVRANASGISAPNTGYSDLLTHLGWVENNWNPSFQPPDTTQKENRLLERPLAIRDSAIINATGGPDDFGYTWSNEVAYSWVDVSVDTGLDQDDEAVLFPIGFPFQFYEQTWSEVYVTTNGVLVFGDYHDGLPGGLPIPSPSAPNNMIAPFSDDLSVDPNTNTGKIYYGLGGIEPDRFFVVEWRDVTDYQGENESITFQVILHENGDIVMQYQDASETYNYYTIGIEDSDGQDGLAYPYDVVNESAILFTRPEPAPRTKIYPKYQGAHTHPGAENTYALSITNTGDEGADTFNLTATESWTVTLFASDGTTPLTDTTSDGIVDTGSLNQGDSLDIIAKVITPGYVSLGDYMVSVITATSILDPGVSRTGNIQEAIPAPFAQTYLDRSDDILRTYLALPAGQVEKPASPTMPYIWDMAIAETPNGFIQIWRWASSGVTNLYYSLLDTASGIVSPFILTDNSAELYDVDDYEPAVSVAPDGHIGVIWRRVTRNTISNDYNYNIWFAILNESGAITYGPQNVTGNTTWGEWDGVDNPDFRQPEIAATGDNRFVLSWSNQFTASSGCTSDCDLRNINYTITNNTGGIVKATTQLTDDALDLDKTHENSNLTSLPGDRALITWQCDDGVTMNQDICYAVIDSSGNLDLGATNASNSLAPDLNPDAVQLSTGVAVLTWQSLVGDVYQITVATLDGSYNLVAGPFILNNPAPISWNSFPSVASARDKAVITWLAGGTYQGLYYALVGSDGSILTPPMIFVKALTPEDPQLYTSYKGYGNTSYTIWDHQIYLPLIVR